MKHWMGRTRHALLADPYRLALAVLVLLYLIVFTQLAWNQHAGLRTHKADLGQIDQAIWNSSHGRLLQQTDNGFVATRLTDHVEPVLVLISPIYWLWNDLRALLLLQVLVVAIGAFPLYALTNRQFEKLLTPRQRNQVWELEPLQIWTRPLAFALALAYLLAPQLQSAVLTEFHAAPLAAPLILWAFWAVDARRWMQFVVAALLLALVKEEMALLAAGLGAWALWRAAWDAFQAARNKKQETGYELRDTKHVTRNMLIAGGAVLTLSLAWFYWATFVIVPANAAPLYGTAESTYFQRYGALGDSSADIFKSFFARPALVWQIITEPPRVAYLIGLLVAFAWLPLLGVDVLLFALPVLLANLLSTYPAQYYGEFHYSAPIVPYFAVAAAYGVGRVWRWLARLTARGSPSFQYLPAASAGVMTAAALAQNARTSLRPLITLGLVIWMLAWPVANYLQHGRGPLGGRWDVAPITEHHRLLAHFTGQLPPDAAVTATAAIHPHVSHRAYVYQFPMGLETPKPADWALLDVTTNTDMAPGDVKSTVEAMLAADWGVVDAADGYLLMQRGATNKEIPPEFYSFARMPAASAPLAALALTEVDALDWPRWRQTRLVADWTTGPEFDPAQQEPQFEVVTPAQQVVATQATAAPPALVWQPAAMWAPGETYRLTTLPLVLPRTTAVRTDGGAASIAAIFRRIAHDKLVELPPTMAQQQDLSAALAPGLLAPVRGAEATFALPDGNPLRVQVWTEDRSFWPGDSVDLWLQWEGGAWPESLTPFVHLRRDGGNVAQADGAPAFFGALDADTNMAISGYVNDWRQFQIPAEVDPTGAWQLAIGLYDPVTGMQAPVVDAAGQTLGDELILDGLKVQPAPMPDQTCALLPATCAAQN
ncbi:MAG: DUF2079 domain-containing protein [Anaerolineales bacterium]|nr:DUF2079 domain-containing protein [Anaerolineales bacterium]